METASSEVRLSKRRRRNKNHPIELNDAQNHLKVPKLVNLNTNLGDIANRKDFNDKKYVEVGDCLLERKSPQTSMVNISIETELKSVSAQSNSQLRQTSARGKKKKRKKKCDYKAAQNKDKDNKLPESCSFIKTGSTSVDLSLEIPVNICSKNEAETSQVAARMDETKCLTSSVTEFKTSQFDCDNHSPRKNKEKIKRKRFRKKNKFNAAENNVKDIEFLEYDDNGDIGACLVDKRLCHISAVDSSTVTGLKSAPFDCDLHSPRNDKEKIKRKRKNRHDELPKYSSVVSTGSTKVDVSLHSPVTICSMNELETSQIGACLVETECHTSAVDISTETELKSASFDSDLPLSSTNKEKKHKHIAAETNDKADELLQHNDSSDFGACLVEKSPCHASEVDINTDTELKSTPLGSELSSPMKTRKKKKRKCNAAANNDGDTQKANDNENNSPDFSSFVETTSTEVELLVNICSMNASRSKLDDSETETRKKSSEKEILKSVQEVAESFMEDIKECKDDKNEVGTLVMGKPKSIGGREKRKTKSERKCLRGGLVGGDSVIEVAFRPSANDLGSEYMTEQSKQMNKVKNSEATICENDSINDVVTKTMIEEDVPPMFLSSLDGAYIGGSKKKLLVLDVNGLLADIVPCSRFIRGHIIISRKAVFKRPYCDDFLKFCFQNFNVGIWSSRTKENLGKAINFLIGDSKHKLLFCWDQSHCTATGFNTLGSKEKPLLLKELKKLWENDTLPWGKGEYDESNTLLLDDSPYKALRNPAHTAIFPYPYQFKDARTDSSLGPNGDLRMYLKTIATAENVQKHVEQNHFGQARITETDPSWHFYSKIISFKS